LARSIDENVSEVHGPGDIPKDFENFDLSYGYSELVERQYNLIMKLMAEPLNRHPGQGEFLREGALRG